MKSEINWQDEFEAWYCSSDDLLENLTVNGIPNPNGLLITIDDFTYKITKPNSKFCRDFRMGNRSEARI